MQARLTEPMRPISFLLFLVVGMLARAVLVESQHTGDSVWPECGNARVAAGLGMSTSTLQQRLIDRGTSFHELSNDVRRELACGHLRQPGVSVTEITFLLGFTDVSNFTRAFKRWTGTSPTPLPPARVTAGGGPGLSTRIEPQSPRQTA